jgi:thiamine biosynthesis lipoprotein
MRPASNSRRRARPLLGTFVEIAVAGAPAATMDRAIDAAFDAIAEVHRLMSFHTPDSDVSRINRLAATRPVAVHPWTFRVLEAALDLHRRSVGAFDIAVAPALQALALLPSAPSCPASCRASTSSRRRRKDVDGRDEPGHDGKSNGRGALQLLDNNRVACAPGVAIDLGGIAKGFAVDRARDALVAAGVPQGLVNAGGDLAVFGAAPVPISLRDPRDRRRILCEIDVRDAALASSGTLFDPILGTRAASSAIIDPGSGGTATAACGATVGAPSCMIADALTKLVMIMGEAASTLLREEQASALLVMADGEIRVTRDWPQAVRHAA